MRTRAKISGSQYKNLLISDITDIGYIGADTDTDINIGAPLPLSIQISSCMDLMLAESDCIVFNNSSLLDNPKTVTAK